MIEPISFSENEQNKALSLWPKCKNFLSSMLGEEEFNKWIAPVEPRGLNEEGLTLRVPDEQFAVYLEENFTKELDMMMGYYIGNKAILFFEFANKEVEEQSIREEETSEPPIKADNYVSYLNESLRFETFFESESNRVARTIAESVAERPGQVPLNLLFIYGPSGVGKTHLSQAIGQRVRDRHPNLRVCYVSSAKFEAQYTHDSRFQSKTSFISFYQQMDVLIIDDIQGIIGKPRTQQAFFEIFNHLYLLNKQIILTSDVPPVEFRGMEERLITRIRSSIMIPLERPDIELRRKILSNKVAEYGVHIEEEVLEFLAESLSSNVRELDGAIKTLLTYATISGRAIDINFARSVVSTSVSMTQPEITMEGIQELVAAEYKIDKALLRSATRRSDIALPRQVVMYLTKTHTDHSYNVIAERLGRKNHTTVMHGVRTIKSKMKADKAFAEDIKRLEQRLRSGTSSQA
ncbi:MAG: chromosomal replication initiator protein DnaA [Porphyromonadaceae bacterium]|nr:chromosomal replication initiator protein DnaA [Porphyromonadaceae bacterium]